MRLRIDTILAVLGVIITFILGYLGIRYTLKYRKNTEIIFINHTSISLFKTIVKNLEEIEINFKGNKINENLILLKCSFFNSGNHDIDKSIIHKPLEVELPKNSVWISHKIIDYSEGLTVTSYIKENKLILEWDLMKQGEYFTLDSLIEYKTTESEDNTNDIEKSLINNIKFSHRMTDLKNIKNMKNIPTPMSILGIFISSIIILGLIFYVFYISFGQLVFPSYEILTEYDNGPNKCFVKFEAKNRNEIAILDNNGKSIITTSKDDFSKRITNNIRICKRKVNYWLLIPGGLISTLYLLAWIFIVISQINDNRLYKKIKFIADKYSDVDNRKRSFVFSLIQVGYK